jgi:hypothetical protein
MQGDTGLRLKRGGGGGAGEGIRCRHRRLFTRAAYLGLWSARGDVERRKWRGTCGCPYLGIVGRGEVAARSRNGELLFLKPDDVLGDAPVVLRLRLSFPR